MRQNLIIEQFEQDNNSYQSYEFNQFWQQICDISVVIT